MVQFLSADPFWSETEQRNDRMAGTGDRHLPRGRTNITQDAWILTRSLSIFSFMLLFFLHGLFLLCVSFHFIWFKSAKPLEWLSCPCIHGVGGDLGLMTYLELPFMAIATVYI